MSKRASAELDNGAMEPRGRKLELDSATMAQQINSLFDNGHPGILSQIRNSLSEKIDTYFKTVSEFINGEPARKRHIENNAAQSILEAKTVALEAVADAKALAKETINDKEKDQARMHLENRIQAERTEGEVQKLKENFARHE